MGLREKEIALLRVLSTRALTGAGWKRRSVWGWQFTDELTPDLPFAGELLRALAARALINRDDIRDPGRKLPLYLSRISQHGENFLAAFEERRPRDIKVPATEPTKEDAETLFLPTDAWLGLRILAAIADPHEWTPGNRVSALTRRTFFPEEGEYLQARGLVRIRWPVPSNRRNAPLLYQATELGQKARTVGANEVSTGSRVQVRVPGLTLRTSTPEPLSTAPTARPNDQD